MSRRHALVISILLGLAAVAGTVAVLATASLGLGGQLSDAEIAARTARLDRAEAALRRARAATPPALPALPATTPATSRPERLVSVRTAPAAGPRFEDDEPELEDDEQEQEDAHEYEREEHELDD